MHAEAEHLAQADRHIADAERRILEQEQRIAGMEAAGEETAEAKRLLDLFRSVLVELRIHRQIILDELERA
jgi:hypothetical protein